MENQGHQPKRQHWVPKFYLTYFATPETISTDTPRAWIFSKRHSDREEALTSVEKICRTWYLYSPEDDAKEKQFGLEKRLSDLEGTIGLLWVELANRDLDLSADPVRKGISLFISTLYLRHPDMLEFVSRSAEQFVRVKYPDASQMTSNFENECKKAFVSFIQNEAITVAEMLMKKRWSVVIADRPTFVTSDKPVAVRDQAGASTGVGKPGAIVSIPLTQTKVLVLDDKHDESPNLYRQLHDSHSGAFNWFTWHCSSRFMVSGRPIEDVLKEIVLWGDSMGFEADPDLAR